MITNRLPVRSMAMRPPELAESSLAGRAGLARMIVVTSLSAWLAHGLAIGEEDAMVVGKPGVERHVEKTDLPNREHLGNAIERLGQIPRGISDPHGAGFFGDEHFVAGQELEAPRRLQFVGQGGDGIGHAGVIGRPRLPGKHRMVVFLFRRARLDWLAFDQIGRRKARRVAVLQRYDTGRRAGGLVRLGESRRGSQLQFGGQSDRNNREASQSRIHQVAFHVQRSFDFLSMFLSETIAAGAAEQ